MSLTITPICSRTSSRSTPRARRREAAFDRPPVACDEIEREQLIELEEASAQAVVDVVVVVSDIVGQCSDLRLGEAPASQIEREIGIERSQRPARIGHRTVVLGETFEHFHERLSPGWSQ